MRYVSLACQMQGASPNNAAMLLFMELRQVIDNRCPSGLTNAAGCWSSGDRLHVVLANKLHVQVLMLPLQESSRCSGRGCCSAHTGSAGCPLGPSGRRKPS